MEYIYDEKTTKLLSKLSKGLSDYSKELELLLEKKQKEGNLKNYEVADMYYNDPIRAKIISLQKRIIDQSIPVSIVINEGFYSTRIDLS